MNDSDRILRLCAEAWQILDADLEKDRQQVRVTHGTRIINENKYVRALELFRKVLDTDPGYESALHGVRACRLMLEPFEPVQHIAPPQQDSEQGQTEVPDFSMPWELRRYFLERAEQVQKQAVSATGEAFAAADEKAQSEAVRILECARMGLDSGLQAEHDLYTDAENKLRELQRRLDADWKGHGPEIYTAAVIKLGRLCSSAES